MCYARGGLPNDSLDTLDVVQIIWISVSEVVKSLAHYKFIKTFPNLR